MLKSTDSDGGNADEKQKPQKKERKLKQTRLGISISPELYKKVRYFSMENRKTMSDYTICALMERFEKDEKKMSESKIF